MQTTATKMPRSHPPTERSVGRKRTRPKVDRKSTPSQKLAAHLYDLAERSGLSNAELADKVGVTPDAVSKWIKGDSVPNLDLWPKLALALGLKDARELVNF